MHNSSVPRIPADIALNRGSVALLAGSQQTETANQSHAFLMKTHVQRVPVVIVFIKEHHAFHRFTAVFGFRFSKEDLTFRAAVTLLRLILFRGCTT